MVKIAEAKHNDVIIFTRHHPLNLARVDRREYFHHSVIKEIDVASECH